jgi:predicted  nucleic acid-binding Zn-ribbon protein
LDWSINHIVTPKGEKLDFYNHRYLLDIYNDVSPNIVVKKGAQIGVSTYAINKALWFADTHEVSIIYTMPTASDVSDFSKARMAPVIQASPYLQRAVDGGIELKQIGNSFVYFRGAWSERQAISVDSDFNIHDEVDFSKPDIISMYRERMSHSKFKLFLALSTPTIPEFGIDYLFNRSDKKEWFVTCPNCGKKQILKYPDSIRGDTKEARYACVHCLATITDEARRNGEWRRTGDKDWGVSGYHISQLMAPWISATEILRKEEEARIRPTAQLSGIKDFYNFVLGEAYGGENQPINRELLLSCVQNKYEMEEKERNTIMGVDQGDKLHVVIFKKEKDNSLRLIHSGVYDNFEQALPNLMDKYGVTFCLIDALPNKHSARKFAMMYQAKVWLVYYNENQKEFIKWYKDPESKEYRVVVNKMESLDRMADKFKNHSVVLPRLSQDLDLFMRHLCNWAKDKEEDSHGRVTWVYKKLGADHLAMACNYAMLGIEKLSTGFLREPKAEDIPLKDRPITAGVLEKQF